MKLGEQSLRRERGGRHRRTSAWPARGGRGTLIGSALEQSNVDIAQEFTQMILAQRGYQANSKSITVSDELLRRHAQPEAVINGEHRR